MNFPFPIVDAHVHFWNPAKLNYPWLASVPALSRAFLPEDYSAATIKHEVSTMVFVECGCAASQSIDETNWISEISTRETRLKGIVAQASVELGTRVTGELTALAKNPLVKGVRQNLQAETDPYFCLQPNFITGVHALAKFNFTFDLCIVHSQLPAVTQLVARCPEVFFILDHCAKPVIRDQKLNPWRKHLRELAALPNVFVGRFFQVLVNNGTAQTMTLLGGSGVTVQGVATIAAGLSRVFYGIVTNVGTPAVAITG